MWQRNGYFGQDPQSKYLADAGAAARLEACTCDGYVSTMFTYFLARPASSPTARSAARATARSTASSSTNHGCTYDPRNGKIAVSDRANSRFEYFDYDKDDLDKFDYAFTVDMQPEQMAPATPPCNRVRTDQDGRAILASFAGRVAVLDASNTVISVVNVSGLLAADRPRSPARRHHLPAHYDMVVATRNLGGSRNGRNCELLSSSRYV